MSNSEAARRAAAALARLAAVVVLVSNAGPGTTFADEPPPKVIDSQTIVRSLTPATSVTRGFEVAAKPGADADSAGGGSKINLDIRFGNDSDRLSQAAQGQLAALGEALSSAGLAKEKFVIAGHTSASGSAEHNQRLSEARAQAVRVYLIEHFKIAPARIEATGYGSARPLPNFAPAAMQQRRVEIIRLPPNS
jgi:outer membrane protein OmpA-like peptidoglycan-associated protein